jgi:hypothetical protein
MNRSLCPLNFLLEIDLLSFSLNLDGSTVVDADESQTKAASKISYP